VSLHIPATEPIEGQRSIASPSTHDLERVRLDLLTLAPGEAFSSSSEDRELCLVVMGGQVDVQAGSHAWEALGQRANVFGGPATAVYMPPGTAFEVRGAGELGGELAMCQAPAPEGADITLIAPNDVTVRDVGSGNWRRSVQDILAKVPASTLLLGETINAPGNWSSYPPHKHDTEIPGEEVVLEEVYHYRFDPPGGFGVQCVYTEDRSLNEAMLVREGDTVLIPRGYHPVAAAPGYRLYYLWVLAGPRRLMRPHDDPAHAWVKAVEPMLR
jgi:5-deoxy-glucuronate isomerase